MNAIDLLKAEEHTFRYYRIGSKLLDVARYTLDGYRKLFPDRNWDISDYVRLVEPHSHGKYAMYAVRPVICWGPADTSIFRRRWNMVLPEWMEEFYSHVTCAYLPLLHPIVIRSPAEAVYLEEEYRDACEEEHLPYRMFRFANVEGDPYGFALRQRVSDASWCIIPNSHRYAPSDYQSPEADNAESYRDIHGWLLRMLNTDAHPIFFGNENIEPMPYSRELTPTKPLN